MSGIVGVVFFDGRTVAPPLLTAMLAPLRRRGPDRLHGWQQGSAAFGHALLATTPEAGAEVQPRYFPASDCVVVCDARLDNRPELIKALALRDDADAVPGDAQLLHAAWHKWGTACTEHLLGDYAFAIWDRRRNTILCARDPMGVRPLYIHFAAGRLFAFASQPDALLRIRDIPAGLDQGRILDALVPPLEGIDKTCTFFRHIQRLPPAHHAKVHDDRLVIEQYWQPLGAAPLASHAPADAWLEGLRERLTVAVRRRLRSHIRVGAMLSGGLDSSSVVAIAARELDAARKPNLPTFSAVSAEPECPETRAVWEMLSTIPNLDPSLIDFAAAPELMTAIAGDWPNLGEPFDGGMTLVACQYRTAVARGVRVVLDGIDADNLLSEGNYMTQLVRRGRVCAAWRLAVGQSSFFKGPWTPWQFLYPALRSAAAPRALSALLLPWRQRRAARAAIAASWVREGFARPVDLADRLARLYQHAQAGQAQSENAGSNMGSPYTTVGVERYGRVAAASGVEPRHPFLDRELIEFCAWLPYPLRVAGGWPKWALRVAMAPDLPPSVAWRRGKEHLGWRFNLALVPYLNQVLGAEVLQNRSALDPFVRTSELPPWPVSYSSPPCAATAWEPCLELAALQLWLQRNNRQCAA